jgi:general secretion pathway protein K
MTSRRGSALLSVLWLSAALSAIAFSVATTVRGELERAGTASDGVQSYYLARAAIDRALLWIDWGPLYNRPDGTPLYWRPGTTRMYFEFPTGVADVELIPEGSKLNVNQATGEELFRLGLALGVEPERAREIALAILDWRSMPPQGLSEFDAHYLSSPSSFRARHASLEEIEEILLVKGMTPELFHGTYVRETDGRLTPRPGYRECLSVYGTQGTVYVNAAPGPVLAAIGLPPDAVAAIVQARRAGGQFLNMGQLREFTAMAGPAGGRLTLNYGSITTLRATARIRLQNGQLSDLRRTVAALIKFGPTTKDAPYHILRWYDQGGLGVGDLQ